MNCLSAIATTAVVISVLGVPVAAHQVTFKGTVISSESASVRVNVLDEKTKKIAPATFKVDKETKVLRGDKQITWADARVQKGERIAVTVDHDVDETLAYVVRLDEKK